MVIKRDFYLNKLIDRRGNGRIKVITGIRRCGKSVLLLSMTENHWNTRHLSNSSMVSWLQTKDISARIFFNGCSWMAYNLSLN